MQTVFNESELYDHYQVYDHINNSIFQVIDARRANGDIYFKIKNSIFFVSKQSQIYPVFNNLHNSVKQINSMDTNKYPCYLKTKLGGDVIISDDEPDMLATKMIFTPAEEGLYIATKNCSSEVSTNNVIRICSSGCRTQELFNTAFQFIEGIKEYATEKKLT